jgi:hypothetical protein
MSSTPSKGRDETVRVVINDASCLIDLRKVSLVEPTLRLPYHFAVALPVQTNELLDFSEDDWGRLQAAGLEIIDLGPDQVTRAMELRSAYSKLSAEDCFSLTLAESIEESILLTGDSSLNKVAQEFGIEVHGVLWVVDELHRHGVLAPKALCTCLETWRDDLLVRLPGDLIAERLHALSKL